MTSHPHAAAGVRIVRIARIRSAPSRSPMGRQRAQPAALFEERPAITRI